MSRSSLTEETPATPGWVEAKAKAIFAPLGAAVTEIRDAYLDCLAGVRGAVDSDAGHDRCRTVAVRAAADFIDDPAALDRALQALEAELSQAT